MKAVKMWDDQMVAGYVTYGAVGVVGILAMIIGIIIAHCRLCCTHQTITVAEFHVDFICSAFTPLYCCFTHYTDLLVDCTWKRYEKVSNNVSNKCQTKVIFCPCIFFGVVVCFTIIADACVWNIELLLGAVCLTDTGAVPFPSASTHIAGCCHP